MNLPVDQQAALYCLIGNCYYSMGCLDEAFRSHKKCLSTAEKAHDQTAVSAAYSNIRVIVRLKGDIDNALVYTKKST